MELADLYALRRGRLADLVNGPRFRGVRAECARHIGRSPSQLSQWLGGHRSITEESRDLIEQKCELPRGWLDTPAPQPGATRGPVPAPTVLPTLPQALQALLGTVSGLSGMRLTMARAALHQLVDHPEMLDDAAEQLAHLVADEAAARSKRSSAA